MRVAVVGDIATQIRGVTYAKDDASDRPKPDFTPILRANNITNSGLQFADLVYVPESNVRFRQKLKEGDVVIAASSGSLDVVGKAAPVEVKFDGSFGAFCKVLRPDSTKVDPGYFSHFFRTRTYRKTISRLAAGANINNLKNEHLDNLEIPLPPLPEQRRIAAILDKADALRRKRKRAIELLDSLTQSIFLEMFGDLTQSVKFPKGIIADWVKDFDTGKNLAPEPNIRSNSYRVLKVSAVTSGIFLPEESKPLPPDYDPPKSHLVHTGDLLFSRANTAELIGAAAIVDCDVEKLVLPDKIWRFVWNETNASNPLFIYALFRSRAMRREISKRATGTSGSMKNISKEKVLRIPVALPGIELQERFVSMLEVSFRSGTKAKAQLVLAEVLFTSLQSRAFSGQL